VSHTHSGTSLDVLDRIDKFLLDTDVIIGYLTGDDHYPRSKRLLGYLFDRLRAKNATVYCSVITRAEVWHNMERGWDHAMAEALLSPSPRHLERRVIEHVEVDWDLAVRAAELAEHMHQELTRRYQDHPALRQAILDAIERLRNEQLADGAPDPTAGLDRTAIVREMPLEMFGKKRNKRKGKWVIDWRLGDALIAACAERVGAALITANKFDFRHWNGMLGRTQILFLREIVPTP